MVVWKSNTFNTEISGLCIDDMIMNKDGNTIKYIDIAMKYLENCNFCPDATHW